MKLQTAEKESGFKMEYRLTEIEEMIVAGCLAGTYTILFILGGIWMNLGF